MAFACAAANEHSLYLLLQQMFGLLFNHRQIQGAIAMKRGVRSGHQAVNTREHGRFPVG